MVNANTENVQYGWERGNKWYNSDRFPILPNIRVKKADFHNTSSFSFRWIFINMWILDGPNFEVGIVASSHWGIGFLFLLPYLRLAITIPYPAKLEYWVSRNFNRKPQILKNNGESDLDY
tara:strand:- start:76 stop:435 length:360 start_codon:yes stop_codon:yes gene_type:complete